MATPERDDQDEELDRIFGGLGAIPSAPRDPALPPPSAPIATSRPERSTQDAALDSVFQGFGVDADRRATAARNANRLGTTVQVGRDAEDRLAVNAQRRDARERIEASPNLASWFARNPHHGAIAHDDTEVLAGIEKNFSFLPPAMRRPLAAAVAIQMGPSTRLTGESVNRFMDGVSRPYHSVRAGMLDSEIGGVQARIQTDLRETGQFQARDFWRIAELTKARNEQISRALPANTIVGDTLRAAPGSIGGAFARIAGPFQSARAIYGGEDGDEFSKLLARGREEALANIVAGRGDPIDNTLALLAGTVLPGVASAFAFGAEVPSLLRPGPSPASYQYSYNLESGGAFEEFLGMGMDPMLAAKYADRAGHASAMIEQVGGVYAMGRVGALGARAEAAALKQMTRRAIIREYLKETGKVALVEGFGEEVAQRASTVLFGEYGKAEHEALTGQRLAALDMNATVRGALYEGVIGTVLGGGMGVAYQTPGLMRDLAYAEQAKANTQAILRLAEGSKASKLAGRDPEAYSDAVNTMTGEATVLIDADGFVSLAQSSDMDPDELADKLGIGRDALAAAQAGSGYIEISAGDYASKIGRTAFGASLAQHVTTDIATPTSARVETLQAVYEARSAEAEKGKAKAVEALKRVRESAGDEKPLKGEDAEVAAVIRDVEAQLNALPAGRRMDKATNAALSMIFQLRAISDMSAKSPDQRRSVSDIWKQYRVNFISDLTNAGPTRPFRNAEEIETDRSRMATEYLAFAEDEGVMDGAGAVDALAHAIAAKDLGLARGGVVASLYADLSRSDKARATKRAKVLVKEAEDAAFNGPQSIRDNFLIEQARALGYKGASVDGAKEFLNEAAPMRGPALSQFVGTETTMSFQQELDYDLALQMHEQGVDKHEIWLMTGWHKFGPHDLDWQRELDTSSWKFHDDFRLQLEADRQTTTVQLSDILDAPELFEIRPDLAGIDVDIAYGKNFANPKAMVSGYFHHNYTHDTVETEYGGYKIQYRSLIYLRARNADNMQEALVSVLHEVQHAIQRSAGWSPGTSPDAAERENPEVYHSILKRVVDLAMEDWTATIKPTLKMTAPSDFDQRLVFEKMYRPYAKFQTYLRRRGEVQARNVEARKGMTASERATQGPWMTWEFAEDMQLEGLHRVLPTTMVALRTEAIDTPHQTALAFGTEEELAELRALADRGVDANELFAHPVYDRIRAHVDASTPTLTRAQSVDVEFLKNRKFAGGMALDQVLLALRERFEGGRTRNEKRAVVVIGPPGAGKSSFIKDIAGVRGAAIVDLDVAREYTADYADGYNTQAVHLESATLRTLVLEDLMADGANVMIEAVGQDPADVSRRIMTMRSAGYDVDLVHVAVEVNEAARRSVRRFIDNGRYVWPGVYEVVGNNVPASFSKVIADLGIETYVEIDANGPQGQAKIIRAQGASDLIAGMASRLGAAARDPSSIQEGGDVLSGGAQVEVGGGLSPELRYSKTLSAGVSGSRPQEADDGGSKKGDQEGDQKGGQEGRNQDGDEARRDQEDGSGVVTLAQSIGPKGRAARRGPSSLADIEVARMQQMAKAIEEAGACAAASLTPVGAVPLTTALAPIMAGNAVAAAAAIPIGVVGVPALVASNDDVTDAMKLRSIQREPIPTPTFYPPEAFEPTAGDRFQNPVLEPGQAYVAPDPDGETDKGGKSRTSDGSAGKYYEPFTPKNIPKDPIE